MLITITLLFIISSRNIRSNATRITNGTNGHTLALITILISLGLTSSLIAPLPIYAFTETITFLSLAMLALIIATATLERSNLIIIVVILASWAFLIRFEVEFLTSYIAAIIIDGKIDHQLLFPRFSNIRFFNQFQIWLIPLSLAPLITIKIENKAIRHLLFLIAGLWVTILITTQSKGAQLALLTGLLIVYIVYKKSSWELIRTTLIVMAIGIIAYLILFLFLPNIIHSITGEQLHSTNALHNIENLESSKARLTLWKAAIDHIQTNPLLGIGPMHYAYYPGQHAHPHNSVLQISSEFGIPVFIVSMYLFILFIKNWILVSSRTDQFNHDKSGLSSILRIQLIDNQQIWITLFFSLMSGLIYSMVSGVFVMPMPQTMMAIIFGLMIGLLNLKRQFEPNTSPLIHSLTIQLTAGLLAIGLLLSVLPHLTTRVLNPFFATYLPVHTAGPRYWELGGLIQNPAPNTFFYYEHPALTASTIKSQN